MCGRFTLHTRLIRIEEEFGPLEPEEGFEHAPSYNIAPSSEVAVVHETGGARRLVRARWGITPPWDEHGRPLINARAETVDKKPTFRKAFESGRCLVLADGFFEWMRKGSARTPFYFALKSGAPFGFAGLFVPGKREGTPSCAIITTAANSLVVEVHERMPVMLPRGVREDWLSAGTGADALKGMLGPLEPGLMKGYEVSGRVNSASEDSPGLIEPVAA
jgi:putative SOS response-associated peptidase YedK